MPWKTHPGPLAVAVLAVVAYVAYGKLEESAVGQDLRWTPKTGQVLREGLPSERPVGGHPS
jgi:hypothetical protein